VKVEGLLHVLEEFSSGRETGLAGKLAESDRSLDGLGVDVAVDGIGFGGKLPLFDVGDRAAVLDDLPERFSVIIGFLP
jgi:hypothetical protein